MFILSFKKKKKRGQIFLCRSLKGLTEKNHLCGSLKGFSDKITIKCIRHNIYEWEFTNGDAPLDKDH